MTDPTPPARPEPDPARSPGPTPTTAPGRPAAPAPDPIGEMVPGDPPVPITVWHLPRPQAGTVMSVGLVRRLIANYTRPGAVVVDLTTGARLGRSGRHPAALIVTGWPAGQVTPTEHLSACAAHLDAGGCVAVVLDATQTPDLLGVLVTAARAAGLTYLQHVVVAHQLTPRVATAAAAVDAGSGSSRGGLRLRVHTDLLIFRAPRISSRSLDPGRP